MVMVEGGYQGADGGGFPRAGHSHDECVVFREEHLLHGLFLRFVESCTKHRGKFNWVSVTCHQWKSALGKEKSQEKNVETFQDVSHRVLCLSGQNSAEVEDKLWRSQVNDQLPQTITEKKTNKNKTSSHKNHLSVSGF